MCEGKREINQNNEKQEWERTRWQTWQLINIHLERTKKLRTPKALITFDWEISDARLITEQQNKAFEKLKEDIEIIDRKGNWKTIN